MNSTQRIHEKILDFLIKENKKNPDFYFATRQKNNDGRLNKGYWFQGNDAYVYVSFWEGTDWQRKVRNIGFVVDSETKKNWLELSTKEDYAKIPFIEIIANKLGFYKVKADGIYYKDLDGTDYLKNLKSFLEKEKLEIDKLIEKHKPNNISIIQKEDFEKYKKTINRRLSQVEFGETHKIVRLCWNKNGWKFPSGIRGKSLNSYTYENQYGFGHEEWLFDKSKIVNGYHYAFIEAFRIKKSDKHIKKTYNVKLYSIDSIKNIRYYVGEIKNLKGVSEKESEDIYKIYSEKGWLKEMMKQVHAIGGEWNSTIANDAKILFNIKFKFDDAILFDEYEIIAQDDINITSDHFVLLPQKTEISVEYVEESEDNNDGNFKNTTKRKRVVDHETTYEPYHDMMQNALCELLREQKEIYKRVKIERDRVDLKAETIEGDWHYFELKTDSTKLSIRKAIGQIMEYAYYPNRERASKLIVVSDSEPTDRDMNYLKHIREKFEIPIFYRYFKYQTKFLSEEY